MKKNDFISIKKAVTKKTEALISNARNVIHQCTSTAAGKVRTEKSSVMMPVADICKEAPFESLFPLNESTVDRIADSIKEKGFDSSQSLHIWKNNGRFILIDGYTRLAAAGKAGVGKVPVFIHDFLDEQAALRYALGLQVNRRNLSDSELLTAMEQLDYMNDRGKKQGADAAGRSRDAIAKTIGVSPRQVQKVRAVIKNAPEQSKLDIKAGTTTINKVYNQLKESADEQSHSTQEITTAAERTEQKLSSEHKTKRISKSDHTAKKQEDCIHIFRLGFAYAVKEAAVSTPLPEPSDEAILALCK